MEKTIQKTQIDTSVEAMDWEDIPEPNAMSVLTPKPNVVVGDDLLKQNSLVYLTSTFGGLDISVGSYEDFIRDIQKLRSSTPISHNAENTERLESTKYSTPLMVATFNVDDSDEKYDDDEILTPGKRFKLAYV